MESPHLSQVIPSSNVGTCWLLDTLLVANLFFPIHWLALQVRVDVERSLHSFAAFLTDEERAARRAELQRLLNAVVVRHEGELRGSCCKGEELQCRDVMAKSVYAASYLAGSVAVLLMKRQWGCW